MRMVPKCVTRDCENRFILDGAERHYESRAIRPNGEFTVAMLPFIPMGWVANIVANLDGVETIANFTCADCDTLVNK